MPLNEKPILRYDLSNFYYKDENWYNHCNELELERMLNFLKYKLKFRYGFYTTNKMVEITRKLQSYKVR